MSEMKIAINQSISILLVKKADIIPCSRILQETYNSGVLQEGWTDQTAETWIKFNIKRQKDLFFVAKKDNKVVGFIFGYIKPWADGNQLMLEENCVDKNCRKQGISKALLTQICVAAKEKYSATKINGTTYEDDARMPMLMYEKLDFSKITELFLIENDIELVLDNLNNMTKNILDKQKFKQL